ncbi:hypothetical protein OC842_007530 [Tilletia horrida]|uniref:Uncharacterized protein n=1 Tax=Tilletia horrida TaxID=155126 RepID=A0AAN6G458_9BASI|nr:hypothetical protein OC842_007530 [Tilletia horrida]
MAVNQKPDIGQAVVKFLSDKNKTAIAVLGMAPSTSAPDPPGAPKILSIKVD